MEIMKKFENMKASYITVRIEAVEIEKLLNFLWNKNVEIRNIKNNNKFSVDLQVAFKDYSLLREGVKKVKGKINVIDRSGVGFLIIRLNSRRFFLVGIVVFLCVLYYLSRFIWQIDIITERYLAPVEVRNMLKSYGVNTITKKSSIDVTRIEKDLVRDFDEIMWIKVRIEGSRLSVEIKERQEPPQIKEKSQYTGQVVAKKDAVINRVNTISGTPVVKPGQVVTTGQVLIKGEEGKEGMEFQVMAEGKVPATVFYDEKVEVAKSHTEMARTGKKKVRYGINVNNKIIYIGKSLNNFANYDKIETKMGILIKEEYYETQEVEQLTDTDKIIKDLENKIYLNIDRAAKVLEVTPNVKDLGDKYEIRVLATVEEDIAIIETLEPIIEEETQELEEEDSP